MSVALTGAQEWQAANAAFTQLSSLEQAAHCWLIDASRQSRNGSNTTHIHGGNNDVFSGNLVDLSTLAQKTLALQTSGGTGCSAGTMSGNTFANSIIISGGGGGGYNVLSGSPVNAPTIANNAYRNYAVRRSARAARTATLTPFRKTRSSPVGLIISRLVALSSVAPPVSRGS